MPVPPLPHHSACSNTCLLFGRILLLLALTLPVAATVMAELPEPANLTPVVVEVTTLDENGAALSLMQVRAVNHEYGFRVEGLTDGSGKVSLELMSGTWTFHANPRLDTLQAFPGEAYYLVNAGKQLGPLTEFALTLKPTETIPVRLSSSVLDFSSPGRGNYVGFVALPYGKYVEASAAGYTETDELILHTNTGIEARSFIASPGYGSMDTVYFVQPSQSLSGSITIDVNTDNSGLLEFISHTGTGGDANTSMQLNTDALSWAWSAWGFGGPPGPFRLRVSAHDYIVLRTVEDSESENEIYRLIVNPAYVEVNPGEKVTLGAGGALSEPLVRTTPRPSDYPGSRTQLMALMRDAHDNFVHDVAVGSNWSLNPPEVVIHQGNVSSDPFLHYRYFNYGLDGVFDRTENPTYEVSWDFGPWGSGSTQGALYGQEERRMDYHETTGLLSQVPRFDYSFRTAQVKTYELLMSAMETTLGVPTDFKQGVISNINWTGFQDEVNHGFKLELPIELDKATLYPGLVSGQSWYIAHEAGHGRTLNPPASFAAFYVYGEAYSTLSGLKATSLNYGGDAYLKFELGNHNFFLSYLHGEPINDDGDQIESMQFITHYINTHFGWTPHRRMIMEWSNAFAPLRQTLQSQGLSDVEQFATIYSWLCNSNLGMIFQTAGFQATQAAVTNGLAILEAYFNAVTEPKLQLGTNLVKTPQTSIAVELKAPQSAVLTQIGFTLGYEPSKVHFKRLYTRDLTFNEHWKVTSMKETAPGQLLVGLQGSQGISGTGSVAQFNFSILPGVSGELPFTLSDITINGIERPDAAGSLNSPAKPEIGPFPSLPSALAGSAYSTSIWAIGGDAPYSWSVVEDALPPGLALDSASGEISGVSADLGEYLFRVRCTDSGGNQVHRWFTISVTTTSHLLNVNVQGPGAGVVTSSPVGINCGSECSQSFAEKTVVYLVASPLPDNEFLGWQGDEECLDGILRMDASISCTATFRERPLFADGFE
jgi:hypothetical protein